MTLLTGSPPPDAAAYRRGVVLVVAAGVCWSMMGLGIRLIEGANVWQILFYRSLALAPFLFAIIAVRSRGRPVAVVRRAGLAGVFGGAGLVFAFAGGIFAIQTTTVANAMFLFASAPLFAALFGLVLLREPVRRATWAAIAVASVGVAIMVADGVRLGHAVGNVAALLSAMGFATFTVALRWRQLEDMLPAVFLSGVMAIALAGTVCLALGYSFAIPAQDILIAFGMGVFQLGLGLTLFTFGSKSMPAAELALLSMTEVLLGPVWVWLFLGETAGALTLLGGLVLMGALAGNALSGLRRRPTPIL
jgi:drug/metabolite transporter (DMT)-like permease